MKLLRKFCYFASSGLAFLYFLSGYLKWSRGLFYNVEMAIKTKQIKNYMVDLKIKDHHIETSGGISFVLEGKFDAHITLGPSM